MPTAGLSADALGKRIHSLLQTVAVDLAVLGLEHRIDALSAGYILIDIDGFLLIAGQGQEVVDVLVIGKREHHRKQRHDHSQQKSREQGFALMEDVI